MGRKIFVSYKYADDQVENLRVLENSTVRDYVTEFENFIDSTDHIYKGESDGEDLSSLSRHSHFHNYMCVITIIPVETIASGR